MAHVHKLIYAYETTEKQTFDFVYFNTFLLTKLIKRLGTVRQTTNSKVRQTTNSKRRKKKYSYESNVAIHLKICRRFEPSKRVIYPRIFSLSFQCPSGIQFYRFRQTKIMLLRCYFVQMKRPVC